MAIPTQTLRELRTFLLSDFVQIKGTQIPIVTGFLQALANEEQLQANQQAAATRVRPSSMPDG